MPKYTTESIRNLAIAGHAGAGKTTLVEQFLHTAGEIGRVGRVEDGNTVCDFDDIEKETHHSIDSALVHFDHGDAHVNLIDTPGAPDFLGKTISVLPAAETVAVVIDAHSGIAPSTRRVMKVCGEHGIPRLIVVNKIDGAPSLDEVVAGIQETFGSACRPINLPTDGGKGVIDCLSNTEGSSDIGDVSDFHTAIVDQIVEVDEALMETYLEQGEVSPEQLTEAFGQALREGHLIPMCFTSARDNVGVTELMDVMAKLCPDPTHGNPWSFTCEGADWTADITGSDLVAHVFKVSSDPFVGKLCVFKVHQGHVGSDVQPRVDDAKKGSRISHVFKLQGKNHSEVDSIIAGDIGAVAKVEEIHYNSVLHDGAVASDITVKAVGLQKPMYGLSIEGTSKGADTKLGEALHKITAEDPTVAVDRIQTTGETVLRGLGELHLRLKLKMLKDRYGIEVETHTPKVAYKETITTKADGHHRHKKQTGGAGQFGEVYLRVEPLSGDEDGVVNGLLFVDETFGGSVPKQFMPAIEKGIRQVMIDGAIAGYPLQNVRVAVYDGKHHPVDSKEVAFITAGKKAFIDAVQKAKPVLLEPFVQMEITVPADKVGDISSDLSGRRGRIQGTDILPGNQAVVMAEAPLSEMQTYPSQLKSITGGAGSYTMDYSHDERTPPDVQKAVVAKFKPRDDDD